MKMLRSLLTILVLLVLANCGQSVPAFAGDLPDPAMTPGAVNPDITQDNIEQTICNHHGWSTKSIRPPSSYTNNLKYRQIGQYRLSDTNVKHYEEDHLIPLTLGGNPADPRNLWPEKWDGEWGAHKKDRLEVHLNGMVCAHQIPLAQAQCEISTDWIKAYRKYLMADNWVKKIGNCQ